MCKVNMSSVDACEECALKCLLIHKKKRDPSSLVSSFFKVMIDAHFLRFLPVPPRFAPRLASLAGQEIRVEDSSGRKSTVTLSSVNNCLGFAKGWHAFSLDHGIELGDFVIVHYILDSHFVVQIFGRTGCEKLSLPSESNTFPNKRIKTTTDPVARDGSCKRSGKDSTTLFNSGLRVAATPRNMDLKGSLRSHLDGCSLEKNKEVGHHSSVSTEEPSLIMVNRNIPAAREDERSTVFDMFAPEISISKCGGEVDNVPKGNALSNVKDRADNHIAYEDVLKGIFDAKMVETNENGKVWQGNGDSETNITQSEGATNLEVPEQLNSGCSNDKDMLDYDTTFEDLFGESLDVNISEIIEKVNDESKDHKCNSVTTEENKIIAATNPTELRSGQVMETPKPLPKTTDLSPSPNWRQIDGNDGKSTSVDSVEPAPATSGSRSMNVGSNPELYRSHAVIPVSECIGQNVKIVKNENKEFYQEQVGSESEPIVTGILLENQNAATSSRELRQILKAEPVADDHP